VYRRLLSQAVRDRTNAGLSEVIARINTEEENW
jgi:hypothetical protein